MSTLHFKDSEFVVTFTGMPNNLPDCYVERRDQIFAKLEQLRSVNNGRPIRINSGYRSKEVNAAVGGVSLSAHCSAKAVDITCGSKSLNKRLFCSLVNYIEFHKCIVEKDFSWLHVEFLGSDKRISFID